MASSVFSILLRASQDVLRAAECRPEGSNAATHSTGLVRFVLLHALVGAALGIATACAMLLTDAAGLRSLIFGSDDATTPLIMLLAGFGIIVGGLYVASAVMLLAGDE